MEFFAFTTACLTTPSGFSETFRNRFEPPFRHAMDAHAVYPFGQSVESSGWRVRSERAADRFSTYAAVHRLSPSDSPPARPKSYAGTGLARIHLPSPHCAQDSPTSMSTADDHPERRRTDTRSTPLAYCQKERQRSHMQGPREQSDG